MQSIEVPKAVTDARRLVSAWDSFVATVQETPPTNLPLTGSVKNKILILLNGVPTSPSELAKKIGNRREVVAAECSLLTRKKIIRRVSRGMYQAKN